MSGQLDSQLNSQDRAVRRRQKMELLDMDSVGKFHVFRLGDDNAPEYVKVLAADATLKAFHNLPVKVHLSLSKTGFSVSDPETGLRIGNPHNRSVLQALSQAARVCQEEAGDLKVYRETVKRNKEECLKKIESA